MIGNYVIGKNPDGKFDVGYVIRKTYSTDTYVVRWFAYRGLNNQEHPAKTLKIVDDTKIKLTKGTKLESKDGMVSRIVDVTETSVIISRRGTSSSIDTIRLERSKFMDLIKKFEWTVGNKRREMDRMLLVKALKANGIFPEFMKDSIPKIRTVKEGMVIKTRSRNIEESFSVARVLDDIIIIATEAGATAIINPIKKHMNVSADVVTPATITRDYMLSRYTIWSSDKMFDKLTSISLDGHLLYILTKDEYDKCSVGN